MGRKSMLSMLRWLSSIALHAADLAGERFYGICPRSKQCCADTGA